MNTFSHSRLTLYAFLSAMESDLREAIITYCGKVEDIEQFLGTERCEKCLERFRKESDGESVQLVELVHFLDFADAYEVINANSVLFPQSIARVVAQASPTLQSLIPIRNRVAHSRPLDFEDFDVVWDAVAKFQRLSPQFWAHVATTKNQILENPGAALAQTLPRQIEESVSHNLPIPDFDETGFLGRTFQVDQLVKLILGPYPVISVIGEGGLGKTALALKVAYQILDTPNQPFDAIVWTTAKSATITATEIRRIENAITDSLGILNATVTALGGADSDNPIEEIVEYLRHFKLLLVLDNLETVIDRRIISFLEQLPSGSKVLLTSRIGLGEFERRLKLSPLDSREAVDLLRLLIRLRGIDSLRTMTQDQLRRYCNKMQHNPGYIKWFAAAVQAGARPEQILDQPSLFLDFCLANVYDYLSADSKKILKAMQTVSGNLGQAEISVLTEMHVLALQRAIHQLLSTNMLVMRSVGDGAHTETKYTLSELAREYLRRNQPVSQDDYRTFMLRQKSISNAHADLEMELSQNRFSAFSIVAISKSDRIVAKYLLDALKSAMRKNFKEAQRFVSLARGLSPSNFEVHRVEAWVHANSGNIAAAEESYEVAIELEPNSAPLRMFYGGFLMRYIHDNARALVQYQEAMRLAQNETHIMVELARLHIFLHNYDESEKLVQLIESCGTMPAWLQRKVYDLRLQIDQRQADDHLRQHDHVAALVHLEKLIATYDKAPRELNDPHACNTMGRAYGISLRCSRFSGDNSENSRSSKVMETLKKALIELGVYRGNDDRSVQEKFGYICRVNTVKRCGFIRVEDGVEFYFSYVQVVNRNMFDPTVGDEITFRIGENHMGQCAVNCCIHR